MKKFFTIEERIEFYNKRIAHAKSRLAALFRELEREENPDYQDWNGELQKQLDEKRRKRRTNAR